MPGLFLFLFLSYFGFCWGNDKYYSSASQFHPTGRILATENSKKVVATKGGPVCALKCKDGIVLSASRRVQPNSLLIDSPRKIFHVDRHITMAVSGIVSASGGLLRYARSLCSKHRYIYSSPIPVEKFCENLAIEIHKATRGEDGAPYPPAVSVVVCGWDEELGPQVFTVDPEGSSRGWNAIAIGAHSNVLLNELADIVDEEQSGRLKEDTRPSNTMNNVWPKFKSRILRKYFKNTQEGDNDAPLQARVGSGSASDELDWAGGLPGEAGEWKTEVYSCLRASTGEVCWSKVAD